jgi:hypothetical protein
VLRPPLLLPAELEARACAAVDVLLSQHLELLFGQHFSVALAAAIYFTVGGWGIGEACSTRNLQPKGPVQLLFRHCRSCPACCS